MYKSVILPLAKQDILEAAIWYNNRQPGLGKRFTAHVRKMVHYIRKSHNAVAVRYDDTRAIPLETFPYMIHFTVDESKKQIIIGAVLNTARDPKIWRDRL